MCQRPHITKLDDHRPVLYFRRPPLRRPNNNERTIFHVRTTTATTTVDEIAHHQQNRIVQIPYRYNDRVQNLCEQQKFILFIRILFLFIRRFEDNDVYASTRLRAKIVIQGCILRNRMKDERYTPLRKSIISRLRVFIHEQYWTLTRDYVGYSFD